MRRLLLSLLSLFTLIIFFISNQVYAVAPISPPQSNCVTASGGAPIPIAYSLTNTQSRILSLLTNSVAKHFAVTLNTLASEVQFSISSNSNLSVPTTSFVNLNQIYVPATFTPAFDDVLVSNVVMVASATGSPIASGSICAQVW